MKIPWSLVSTEISYQNVRVQQADLTNVLNIHKMIVCRCIAVSVLKCTIQIQKNITTMTAYILLHNRSTNKICLIELRCTDLIQPKSGSSVITDTPILIAISYNRPQFQMLLPDFLLSKSHFSYIIYPKPKSVLHLTQSKNRYQRLYFIIIITIIIQRAGLQAS